LARTGANPRGTSLACGVVLSIPWRKVTPMRWSVETDAVTGDDFISVDERGQSLLLDPFTNKGTAFDAREREQLGLEGLVPPAICTIDQQLERVYENYRVKSTNLERYIHLASLQDRNETLFFRLLHEHLVEMMPIVYTPVVGEACQRFSHIYRRARGLYISYEQRDRIEQILRNHPLQPAVIVVTDGERILGLGDQGVGGMGIPIGKLALYTACAGIDPRWCLPVTLDVGTNNDDLLNDVLYLGYPRKRLEGKAYFDLVDEFVRAVQSRYPEALLQFEDFLTPNAYVLLTKYRQRVLCFNDDIQGTAAVALAGVYSSTRITKIPFRDLTIMFLGAGSAATGIADLMTSAFVDEGLTIEDARRHLWFVDLNGLVVRQRTDLLPHNLPYAHDVPPLNFLEAIDAIRPHVLIGATGAPGTFSRTVIERMSVHNQRPVIFALSNPTSKAECSAEDAYRHTAGRALFACGSPYDPVTFNGKTFVPRQGNNSYIFPGVGLGAIASGAKLVTDEMFMAAARTLAGLVTEEDINQGSLYPALPRIREVSAHIGAAVAKVAYKRKLAKGRQPKNVMAHVKSFIYEARY
jgi:malate dehydrogenase (oxaloacetate-decarboxylating)(NADP+)